MVTPPKMLGQMKGFIHGCRDFIYLWEKGPFPHFILLIVLGILFILLSDMNIASRIDSYLTNLRMPWEKKEPNTAPIVCVGALGCYLQVKDYKYKKLWKKLFSVQVSSDIVF